MTPLELDDPLNTTTADPPRQQRSSSKPSSGPTRRGGSGRRARPVSETPAAPAAQPAQRPSTDANDPESPAPVVVASEPLWREWGGLARPATYRLPDELLAELEQRVERLRIPKGLTVAAGLLTVLDLDDAELLRVLDRAEDAQDRARRQRRRR